MWSRRFLFSKISFKKVDRWFVADVINNVLKWSLVHTFIALQLKYPITTFIVHINILLTAFFLFFYYMAIENKRQNSGEGQQVWLTGAQLVVCLLHILRDNYLFSTCLNKRSRFTCSSPGLKWILKIETHGKAIQEASAEHHDQIEKKSVLMCKFTQERFRCWYCSIQTLGRFIALQSRAQPINGLL